MEKINTDITEMSSTENTTMVFSAFWEKNKGLIQFTGIICGVGALFLAIPESKNANAQKALLSIQFTWILFISVILIIFFIKLYSYFYEFEKQLAKKHNYVFLLQGTVSFVALNLMLIFCINLWIYTIALYKKPFLNFIGAFIQATIFLALAFILTFISRAKNKINESLYILIRSLIYAIMATFATHLYWFFSDNTALNLNSLFISFILIFIPLFGINILTVAIRKNK